MGYYMNEGKDGGDRKRGEDNFDRECKFTPGEKVQHKLTNDWLIVVRIGEHQVKCRNKRGALVWLYDEELTSINN